MSTKIFLSVLFASSLLSISCKKELEPQESYSTTGTSKTEADTKTASANANATPVQPNNSVPNTAGKTAPGMNPAHGQPGHRCEVAVGAPLNSTAGKTVSTQTITPTSQTTTNTVVQSTPTKIAPGMNPAHGQPGHRCDIKVGEPLNSPASKAVASAPTGTSGTVSMPINVSAAEANQKFIRNSHSCNFKPHSNYNRTRNESSPWTARPRM